MYRVELKEKDGWRVGDYVFVLVPNVPCGVERQSCRRKDSHSRNRFLMYRVELKVVRTLFLGFTAITQFLMYRVELKGYLVMGRA